MKLDAAPAAGGAGDVGDLVAPAEGPELVAALARGLEESDPDLVDGERLHPHLCRRLHRRAVGALRPLDRLPARFAHRPLESADAADRMGRQKRRSRLPRPAHIHADLGLHANIDDLLSKPVRNAKADLLEYGNDYLAFIRRHPPFSSAEELIGAYRRELEQRWQEQVAPR